MLDEEEFAHINQLYRTCFQNAPRYLAERRRRGEAPSIDDAFAPVRDEYERMTGMACHHNAILHHRISIYGPPCPACGKPMRTPRARFCAACGEVVQTPE